MLVSVDLKQVSSTHQENREELLDAPTGFWIRATSQPHLMLAEHVTWNLLTWDCPRLRAGGTVKTKKRNLDLKTEGDNLDKSRGSNVIQIFTVTFSSCRWTNGPTTSRIHPLFPTKQHGNQTKPTTMLLAVSIRRFSHDLQPLRACPTPLPAKLQQAAAYQPLKQSSREWLREAGATCRESYRLLPLAENQSKRQNLR